MRLYDNDAYREEFMALVYDLLDSDGTNDRSNQIIDAFDMAPAVEAYQLPPSAPLTLDELREMKLFEWIWISVLHPSKRQVFRNIKSEYYKIFEDYTDGTSICCGWPGLIYQFDYDEYGKTWVAYRRKPEEAPTSSDEETGPQRATEPWKDFLMTRFERKEGPA